MIVPKFLNEFLPKYSALIFGTLKLEFERNYVELLFTTNILSKTADARPYLTLNISIAIC